MDELSHFIGAIIALLHKHHHQTMLRADITFKIYMNNNLRTHDESHAISKTIEQLKILIHQPYPSVENNFHWFRKNKGEIK